MSPRRKSIDENTVKSLVSEFDTAIKQGKAEWVRGKLRELSTCQLPRTRLSALAAIGRRAEAVDLSLKWLNGIVRPGKALAKPATFEEMAEYAACLIKIGANAEAINLLSRIDTKECPIANLYFGFAEVAVWHYRAAITHFKRFIEQGHPDAYQLLVARVNLAASFAFEREYDAARDLIEELLKETKEKKLTLLHGNLLELKAQNAIQFSDWKEADDALNQAQELLKETGARFSLFVQKWKVIAELKQHGKTNASEKALLNVKAEAEKLGHWETIRDCDRVLAIASHNRNLALKLYFGTPHRSFREKLVKDWGETLRVPSTWDYSLKAFNDATPLIDVKTGGVRGGKEDLKPDSLLHRALLTLTADLYRPFRLATLFSEIYPGEFFNPQSAPLRLHQMTIRLRQWVKKNSLPLEVREEDNFYRLVSLGNVVFRLSNPEMPTETATEALIAKLKGTLPRGVPFSAKDVSVVLNLSQSSSLRLLNELRDGNHITRSGSGRTVRYFWTAVELAKAL